MLTTYQTPPFAWWLSRLDKERVIASLPESPVPIRFKRLPYAQAQTIFINDEPVEILFDSDFVLACLSDAQRGYQTLLKVYHHELAHIIANALREPYMDGDEIFENLLVDLGAVSSHAVANDNEKPAHDEMKARLASGKLVTYRRHLPDVVAFQFYRFGG